MPGARIPWLLGPINRVFDPFSAWRTRTMSSTGMRSVTQTRRSSSASIPSIMAAAACSGGTKIKLAAAPVASFAAATVSKTGKSRWLRPPLPGTTPATSLVPYDSMRAQ